MLIIMISAVSNPFRTLLRAVVSDFGGKNNHGNAAAAVSLPRNMS
jgi:hypothetical protein